MGLRCDKINSLVSFAFIRYNMNERYIVTT